MGSVYIAPDGVFYSSGQRSTDGEHWTAIPNCPSLYSVNGSTPLVQAGSTMILSSGLISPNGYSAPVNADGGLGPFTTIPFPAGTAWGGSGLDYDATYQIVYSYNLTSGLWRLRVR
jgi:hypothetical protein